MNIKDIVQAKLWDHIESNYTSKKYTNAIIDAMLFLSNVLRERAELDDDGIKLVNNAFSKSDPRIRITKMETETEKDMQEGTANIIRGLYQLVRNPRHHEKIVDTENDSDSIILFINFVTELINKSKQSFEIHDFIQVINDEEFVNEEHYIELVVSRIPKRKLFDTLIELYNEKLNCNIDVFHNVSIKILGKLKESDIENFMQRVSKDLMVCNDDGERKCIIRSFSPEKWSVVDEIARIRTENRIIKSIETGKDEKHNLGWFATWCTMLFPYFESKSKLLITLFTKIESGESSQISYCTKYILDKIWSILDDNELDKLEKVKDDPFVLDAEYWFVSKIEERIRKGNKVLYEYVTKRSYSIPDKVKTYFIDAIKEYEKINQRDDFTDDIPF